MSKRRVSLKRAQISSFWIGLAVVCLLWTNPTKSRRALRELEKGNFRKTEKLLRKITSKDTLAPSAYYVYARLYSTVNYSRYQIDSAYNYLLRGIQQWHLLSKQEKKKLNKRDFYIEEMVRFKEVLDSIAFSKARAISTIESYLSFLRKHSTASQREEALRERDSIAFLGAKSTNSSTAYLSFLKEYANAKEQSEATKLYEVLRYQEATERDKLEDLKRFLIEFPQSVYRSVAEKKILELSCLDTYPSTFLNFLKSYPNSTHTKKVLQLLSSIDNEWHNGKFFDHYSLHPLCTDSIENSLSPPEKLFPVFERKGYGFMNKDGDIRILPQYDSISLDYFCKGLVHRYVHLHHRDKNELRDRSGHLLLRGDIEEIFYVGADLLSVEFEGKYGLWHLSAGELIPPLYEQIDYLPSGLFRLKFYDKVGLSNIFGKWLLYPAYRDIQQEGPFLLAKQGDSVWVGLLEELKQALQEGRKPHLQPFEEVDIIEKKYLLAKRGPKTLLLDSLLRPLFVSSSADIQHINKYWISEEDTSFRIFCTDTLLSSSSLLHIDFNKHWLILQQEKRKYALLSLLKQDSLLSSTALRIQKSTFLLDSVLIGYDSLYLVGGAVAVGLTSEAQIIYFPNRAPLQASLEARIYPLAVPNSDSIYTFYQVIDSSKYLLLNNKGDSISDKSYEYVRPLSEKYLVVEENKEKGILDEKGKLRVPLLHKAISYPDSTSLVSLLRGNKFGSLHLLSGYYLAADYDEVPSQFGDLGWKVRYKSNTGVLNKRRKIRIPFQYQDLKYFNSTHYLSQKKEQWTLRSYSTSHKTEGPFETYKILQKEHQKWLLLKSEKGWGLMDEKSNWLIEPKYEQITPIGDTPLAFLASRYVEDAQLYLAIYFSTKGEILHAESHSEKPSLCSENFNEALLD